MKYNNYMINLKIQKGDLFMNQEEFLSELRIFLHELPKDERAEIIEDYKEYFAIKLEEGLREEEVIRQLGSPREIASRIKGGEESSQANKEQDKTRQLIVGICLAVFNLIFILGTVIAVIGVIFGLFIAAISFVLSPIAVIFKLLFGNGYLFEFFISLVLAGIGLLLLPSLIKFSKSFFNILERYAKWNMKLIRGESL